MKILIASDWYTPAVNGVVTSVKNLRRELQRRGHEVRVLTLSQSRFSREEDGVTYLGSIPVGLIYPGARLRTALAGKWVRELVEWGPDVVHTQCEMSTFFLSRRIAEELEIPLIHTYHTVYEDYTHYFSPSERLGKKAVAVLSRKVGTMTDCMIAPTEKVRALLDKYGVETPVYVVPSGIDLQRFRKETPPETLANMRRQAGIPENRRVLVCLGRLAEEKNVEELLRFRAAMGERNITLLLVGGGPWRAKLEELAGELGLTAPDVIFTGMVPPEQVPDWYRMGELFVSASTSETQGLTYAEALAAGVPALCRADSCLDGVIQNGENGWQYTDEADFMEKLEYFLRDADLRQRMAAAALESAEELSAQRFAQRVERIYQERMEQYQRPEVTA